MKKIIVETVSLLTILLFVYAATSKLLDYEKFIIQLGKSPVLAAFAHWIAWCIPSLEIGIAFLLVFKRTQLIALYAAFTLMVVFSAYIICILNFSEYIPCSCGGILENLSWAQHLWFNIIFVMLCALSVMFYPEKQQEIIGR